MAENSEDEPLLGRNSNQGGIDLENRDPKLINEDVAKVQISSFFLFFILKKKHVPYCADDGAC